MNKTEAKYLDRLIHIWKKGMNKECENKDVEKELFLISEELEQNNEHSDFFRSIIKACDFSRQRIKEYEKYGCFRDACAMNYHLLIGDRNKASEYANKVCDARDATKAVEELISKTF